MADSSNKTFSAAAEQVDDEIRGIDSSAYVWKNCPKCKGTGYIATDDGGIMPAQSICPCVVENRRRHACDIRIRSLFGEGGERMTFQHYDPGTNPGNIGAKEGAIAYVSEFPLFREHGAGFALTGAPGAGKTHLATATLIALIKRWDCHPFILSVPQLMQQARKRIDDKNTEDAIERAQHCDVLVLDDLGAERRGSTAGGMTWVDEQLYLILNHRLGSSLPTIFTTNLRKAELASAVEARVARRLDTSTVAWWQVTANAERKSPDMKRLSSLLAAPGRAAVAAPTQSPQMQKLGSILQNPATPGNQGQNR